MSQDTLKPMDAQIDFPQQRLQRRRKLLPWWVVAFTWLFMLSSVIIPVGIVMGLMGYTFEISLLGLTTYEPISVIGLFLILLFLFKGLIAFALWTEKTWAVSVAKLDAVISIVICFGVMGYAMFFLNSFTFRLELVVLFLYYYKMNQLQYDWENFEKPGLADNIVAADFQ